MTLLPILFALALAPQDRDRPTPYKPKGDQTGSLRGIGTIRLVVDRRVSAASTMASEDDIQAEAMKRFGEKKLGLGESETPPERRKPTATFKFQVESVEADGRAGNMIVGKLLVPCVSPNDPNGAPSSVLLWEMRRLWIGPEERVNLRMRENVDLIIDSFAEDYARDNAR